MTSTTRYPQELRERAVETAEFSPFLDAVERSDATLSRLGRAVPQSHPEVLRQIAGSTASFPGRLDGRSEPGQKQLMQPGISGDLGMKG